MPESIERSAKYQLQLIEELLDMSYILQGRLKLNVSLVNLATIISVTLETLNSTAQDKEIQIQTVFEPNIEQVAGDVSRLRQIVWNLLSNAIKFTPKGGQVKIHLCCVDSMAQIRVSDTGVGISPEVLSHIFDDFRPQHGSTTRSLGGLKLGLAIARNLIELHGGTITAESPGIDRGATFTVRLPFKTNSPLIGK